MTSGVSDILWRATVLMTKKVLAAILARGGSKGILRKNLVSLAGKPLIAWSIEAAFKSRFVDDVFVSSDCQDILNTAALYGAGQVVRPKELASDEASSVDALIHLITKLKNTGKDYDYVVLLQPTSPLRTGKDIDEAFETMMRCSATALISVTTPEVSPLKAFIVNNKGHLQGIVNNSYPFTARQKLPATFYANGAIYIIESNYILKNHSLLAEQTAYIEMDISKSIDIDTIKDLKEAERYLL